MPAIGAPNLSLLPGIFNLANLSIGPIAATIEPVEELRNLPKVDVLASAESLSGFSASIRSRAARSAIQMARSRILLGESVDFESIESQAANLALSMSECSVGPVINASGVILHTGLGRARLSEAAAEAVRRAANDHTQVEFELESGQRGNRQDHIRGHLCELTGAESALVVNNCAAAVYLALAALCSGKTVLLSRGQSVEIGGSFRIPDIVRQSGCDLHEVGCTNKTHLRDFADAKTENVGAILRCHPSNFRMIGFVEEPSASELAELAHSRGWRLLDDAGSGTLLDTSELGLERETTLQEAVAAGADVVMSSGDKLLGGPQAGLLLGKSDAIAQIQSHPLARAFRVDKFTLAGLETTLRHYLHAEEDQIPTWKYLRRTPEEILPMAERLSKAYSGKSVVELGESEVGGGSIPGQSLPTYRVGLSSSSATDLARKLRLSRPAILGRIEQNLVWLDPRTMEENEVLIVESILRTL